MNKKIFIVGIIIASILAFIGIGFAAWGIVQQITGSAEGTFTGYTIIDLDNITNDATKQAFVYNEYGFYNEGYSYETSFEIQINAPLKEEAYDLTITLIDQDDFLSNASSITSSATRNNEIGTKTIDIDNINAATTFNVTYTISSDSSHYSEIVSNLGSKSMSLKITATTANGTWTIDKTIILTSSIQSLISINKPSANSGLIYNGADQILVNSGEGYSLSGELKKNAGSYNVTATLVNGYCWSDSDSHTSITIPASIAKKSITLVSPININYSSNKTWAQFQETVLASAFSGIISGDSLSGSLTGMHNGYYKYGTVSGSYVLPSTQTEFGSSYTNVIGSTYQGYFSVSDTNYILTGENTSIIKYKTAKLGSTYYTIEEAFAGSGTISFAGDSSGANTYVTTAFTRLSTSLTGYSSNSSFNLSNRLMVIPYKNEAKEKTRPDNAGSKDSQSNVYSALIILDSITINVSGGTIIVDANVSYSQKYSSTWSYLRGILINHGTINFESSSKLYSFGYLKGNGTLNCYNSTEVVDLLNLYDFSGGTIASDIYDECLPFTAWSLNNISCKAIYYGGSKLKGFSHAILSIVGEQSGTAVIIGSTSDSNCLFKPIANNNSNKIEKKSNPSKTNTSADNTALRSITGNNQKKGIKSSISIFGSYNDSILSVTINVTIKTSKTISAPIPYLDIIIKESSSLSLNNSDYLFLPSSSLTVEDEATLTTNSGVDLVFLKWSYFASNYNYYNNCIDKDDAVLINNGTITINGNISGLVTTAIEEATAIINGAISASHTMYYTTSGSVNFETKTTSAYLYLYKGIELGNQLTKLTSGGTFFSLIDDNGIYGYYATSATINYDSNGSATSYPAKNITIPKGGYTIRAEDIPGAPSKSYYDFNEWRLNEETAIGQTIYCGVILVADYTLINYTINYIDVYNSCSGTGSYHSNPAAFNYETNQSFVEPVNDSLIFGGWYLDSGLSNKLVMLNGEILATNLVSNSVNIYLSWYPSGTNKYTINYQNNNERITCQDSDVIIDTGSYDWSSYSLPNMTGDDNDYEIDVYFDGWYWENTKVNSINSEMFNSDNELTLTAVFVNKNELVVTIIGINRSVYYKPGYTFTVPSLESMGIVLSEELKVVFIQWILSNGTSTTNPVAGDVITLTDQTSLTADIRQYVKVTIGSNNYTTVTVTLDSNSYLVTPGNPATYTNTFNNSNNKKQNGAEFYLTIGSSFKAKYTAGSNSKNNSATISGTSPTTNLGTTDKTYTIPSTSEGVVITPKGESSSCFTSDTLITMADGTKKQIKDLLPTDYIMAYDHYNGELVSTSIIGLINHGYDYYDLIELLFDNGNEISLLGHHDLYDYTLNKYVTIRNDNALEYLNHEFIVFVDGQKLTTKLVNINISTEYTEAWSLISYKYVNTIANNLLSLTPSIDRLYITDEFNEDINYDAETIQNYVEIYGTYSYEEWEEYIPYQIYEGFNMYYITITVGKGQVTIEDIFAYFKWIADLKEEGILRNWY